MKLLIPLVGFLTHCLVVQSYSPNIECINGIRVSIAKFNFTSRHPQSALATICTNKLGVTSIWAAAKTYCTQEEIDAGSEMLAEYCIEEGSLHPIPYSEVLSTLSNDFIATLPMVSYSNIDGKTVWNKSVLISRDLFEAGVKTTVRDFLQQALVEILTCTDRIRQITHHQQKI